MKPIPAAKDPTGRLANLARRAKARSGQRPQVVQLRYACGHELPETTERYSPAGLAELHAQAAKRGCGMCVFDVRTPGVEVREAEARDLQPRVPDRLIGHNVIQEGHR